MEKSQLEKFVNDGKSIRQMAEETGKSATSIRYWLKKFFLNTRIPKFNKGGLSNYKCQPIYFCPDCGERNSENFYRKRGRCKTCHNLVQMDRVKAIRILAIKYKGGKCENCRYDKNLAAFDFHHVDPKEKDINWRSSRHWKWNRLKMELDKCQLLCCRCHRELHYPEWNQGVA